MAYYKLLFGKCQQVGLYIYIGCRGVPNFIGRTLSPSKIAGGAAAGWHRTLFTGLTRPLVDGAAINLMGNLTDAKRSTLISWKSFSWQKKRKTPRYCCCSWFFFSPLISKRLQRVSHLKRIAKLGFDGETWNDRIIGAHDGNFNRQTLDEFYQRIQFSISLQLAIQMRTRWADISVSFFT